MDNNFNQLCVLQGYSLGRHTPENFEDEYKKKGFRVKFAEEVSLRSKRHDVLFYIHNDDIHKFAVQRFLMKPVTARWWEEMVKYTNVPHEYDQNLLNKYPLTW